jgi:hypothetical protein
MRRFLKDNGLSLVVLALFLATLVGQTISGRLAYNEEQRDHGASTVGVAEYLRTGHFAEAVFENWESEFLQMGVYVFLTAFLVQRGSAESKKPDDEREEAGEAEEDDPAAHRDDPDAPWPVRRGGIVLRIYENSLSLAFLLLFLLSFLGHGLGGAAEFNEERREHGQAALTTLGYMASSRFWFESLQNWQSEFLSVYSIVLLSIVLRQRGSPESKPVYAPDRQTGA